ncbi:MAG TPA: hypothetical protein VFO60_01250 [Candidatus Dormibacteraeota bacterium]|nr:hypothetical protein [Candidatus Dormibacteraeota bacterium]
MTANEDLARALERVASPLEIRGGSTGIPVERREDRGEAEAAVPAPEAAGGA